MRILHLDTGREMRGGQWQVLRLHRGLIAAGHESLLLARNGSPLLRKAREWQLRADPFHPALLPFEAQGFDLIHAHDARSHTVACFVPRVPVVVSRRVAFPVKTSRLSRWKYSKPALFLAVSRFVAQELLKAGVSDNRIAVVYDGISVPADEATGTAILTPMSLDQAKCMALAQQAAALAGVKLELSKDLEADLARAGGFVYLSRSEGLGSGILLAMAHGVPVIASNVGGIPELIENGVNGLLVQNEPESVAAAFSRLNRQLGHAARQTVLQRFTEDHMVRATFAAYERVLHA
jgi:glycosyltransferase involved in cell wall biosynthesis